MVWSGSAFHGKSTAAFGEGTIDIARVLFDDATGTYGDRGTGFSSIKTRAATGANQEENLKTRPQDRFRSKAEAIAGYLWKMGAENLAPM